jgi:hypothetical protein
LLATSSPKHQSLGTEQLIETRRRSDALRVHATGFLAACLRAQILHAIASEGHVAGRMTRFFHAMSVNEIRPLRHHPTFFDIAGHEAGLRSKRDASGAQVLRSKSDANRARSPFDA